MTPSNANTSGLEVVDFTKVRRELDYADRRGGLGLDTHEFIRDAIQLIDQSGTLVTAASAQSATDRLKLAICGGEDVPGAINLVTIEDCDRFCREAQAQHGNMIDRATAAEARADRLAETPDELTDRAEACLTLLPSCGDEDARSRLRTKAQTYFHAADLVRAALQQEG